MRNKKRLPKTLWVVFIVILALTACFQARVQHPSATLPGRYEHYTLLPNGWKLSPAGRQIPIGELPLKLLITEDEHYAFTCNSGMGENSLSLIDLQKEKEIQRLVVDKTWRGLAYDGQKKQLYVSGGNDDFVLVFSFQNERLVPADTIFLKAKDEKKSLSVTGLALNARKKQLYAVTRESNLFIALDLPSKRIIKKLSLPGKCYDVIVDHRLQTAYISVWEKAQILPVNLQNFTAQAPIPVGDHPNEMVITKDDTRLFVANANNNSASAVDLDVGKVTETLIASVRADAPYGSTPNALALNADESVLFIANADNNALALFDVSQPGQARSMGFIPVGWYPTAVGFLTKSGQIVVANGKGLSSRANPEGPRPGQKKVSQTQQFIGRLFKGTLSLIHQPDEAQLAKFTRAVYRNTPYVNKKQADSTSQSVIPTLHNGRRSKSIRHVFYIIKENRTYDQVFGDLREGNGDSSLCLFPRDITPNSHRLAEQFALFDNFYVDAEISADGHNWSTAAYATDYVEKIWPVLAGGRGGTYDFEGGVPIAAPSSGYIWDAALNKGLRLRNYGEFTPGKKNKKGLYIARESRLVPSTCPSYPGFNLRIPDTTRYRIWAQDFDSLSAIGRIPDLNIIRLPNDHTAGTLKGMPTIKAMVADNDYALGLIVEHLSHSSVWANSIVFVLEDDAQDGSDHVDAHRSLLFVVGPHVKRHYVDHTMYSTPSVLKTIELILGLRPMTQFDLSAMPILAPITDESNRQSYEAVQPPVNLQQINDGSAYGAKRCAEMNLTVEDAIPEIEFNEIIWKAMRGAQAIMPAPVRSAYVKIIEEDD